MASWTRLFARYAAARIVYGNSRRRTRRVYGTRPTSKGSRENNNAMLLFAGIVLVGYVVGIPVTYFFLHLLTLNDAWGANTAIWVIFWFIFLITSQFKLNEKAATFWFFTVLALFGCCFSVTWNAYRYGGQYFESSHCQRTGCSSYDSFGMNPDHSYYETFRHK